MRALVPGSLLILSSLVAATAALAVTPKSATTAPAVTATATSRVVAYYFHGTQRCRTCMRIESSTEATVRQAFANELASKHLEWRVVNFDTPENEHVITDYGLVAQSVVLVEYRDGKQVRFKNLDKVWRLVNDAKAFDLYIRDEVRAFLGSHD